MDMDANDLNKIFNAMSQQITIIYNSNLECEACFGDVESFSLPHLEPGSLITDVLSHLPIHINDLAIDTLYGESFEATFKVGDSDYLLRSKLFEHDPTYGMMSIIDVTSAFIQWHQEQQNILEQERSQLVYNFIRDVSHEFRSPVTSIKIELYLLAREQDEEKRQYRMERIDKRSDEIIELVDDLKAMATVDFSMTSDVEQVDINSVVQIAYQLIQSQYASHGSSIRLNIDSNAQYTYGNKDELLRAFIEVISNAIRFTPHNGTITVTTMFTRNESRIIIEDDGQGMSEETLAAAFLTFQRGDEAHTTRGLGLGLPMTKRIIERSGGAIHIDSELHRGTTVIISFPKEYVVKQINPKQKLYS